MKKKILCVSVIAICLALAGCDNTASTYKKAQTLIQEEKYVEAVEKFEEISSYADASKYIQYGKAWIAVQNEEYDDAILTFASLNDFMDSDYLETYFTAVRHIENDTYDDDMAAVELFNSIPLFEDSKERSAAVFANIESIYVAAQASIDSDDYQSALDGFNRVYGYEDAERCIEYCEALIMASNTEDVVGCVNGVIALSLMPEFLDAEKFSVYYDAQMYESFGNYAGYKKAQEKYDSILEFKDSASRREQVDQKIEERYQHALELISDGDYDSGYGILTEMSDYSDATEQMNKSKYERGVAYIEAGEYEDGYVLLNQISGYLDSAELIKKSKYERAQECFEQGKYEEAHLLFNAIPNYLDSAGLAQAIENLLLDLMLIDADVGDVINYGVYEQDNHILTVKEPIEWIILEKRENKVLLITKCCIDCRSYNSSYSKNARWEHSALRAWLNDEFLKTAFNDKEKEYIQECVNSNPPNLIYKTTAGNDTTDKIFILNIEEAQKYFTSDEERISPITEYAASESSQYHRGSWWLRTPGSSADLVAYVDGDTGEIVGINPQKYGEIYDGAAMSDRNIAVRPVMWVSIPEADMVGNNKEASDVENVELEVMDSTQKAIDVTELLGSDELIGYKDKFVSFSGMTVEASSSNGSAWLYNWDGSGQDGDDIYFNAIWNGITCTFTVESNAEEAYASAKELKVGDVVNMEGLLCWYEGANPHITSISIANN